MVGYIVDLAIVAILIIGITAFMGVIPNAIGTTFFGGKKRYEYVERTKMTQTGWKLVGGKQKNK